MKIDDIGEFFNNEWQKPWESEQKMREQLKKNGKSIVVELGRTPLPTEYGDWTYIVFGDRTSGQEHDMMVYGELGKDGLKNGEDLLTRLHSSCRSSELFHAVNCECREELEKALTLIQQEKKGAIVYLHQEGAGNGIVGKLKAYSNLFEWKNGKIVQKTNPKTGKAVNVFEAYDMENIIPEHRDFEVVGAMLKSIGVKSVRLLTNNPKKVNGIESAGIKVKQVGLHIPPKNEMVKAHLKTKATMFGHKISDDDIENGEK